MTLPTGEIKRTLTLAAEFFFGKKGSKTKKRMKEEKIEKGDYGPPTRRLLFFFFETQSPKKKNFSYTLCVSLSLLEGNICKVSRSTLQFPWNHKLSFLREQYCSGWHQNTANNLVFFWAKLDILLALKMGTFRGKRTLKRVFRSQVSFAHAWLFIFF